MKAEAGESIVVRAFEIQGDPAAGGINFFGQAGRFSEANLLEEKLPDAEQETFYIKPYEIDTVKLSIR